MIYFVCVNKTKKCTFYLCPFEKLECIRKLNCRCKCAMYIQVYREKGQKTLSQINVLNQYFQLHLIKVLYFVIGFARRIRKVNISKNKHTNPSLTCVRMSQLAYFRHSPRSLPPEKILFHFFSFPLIALRVNHLTNRSWLK